MAIIPNFNPAQGSTNDFMTGLKKKPTGGGILPPTPTSTPLAETPDYNYKTAPSPFTSQNAPTITGALSGEGVTSETKTPLQITQGVLPPQVASMAGRKNIPSKSSIPGVNVAKAGEVDTIQKFLDDTTITPDKKRAMLSALNDNPEEEDAIRQHLKDKYYPQAFTELKKEEPKPEGWAGVKIPSYKPYTEADIEGSPDLFSMETLRNAGRYGANIFGGAANIVGGLGNVALHPVETVKSLGSISKGIWDIAGREDTPEAQQAKAAYNEVITKKYGSWENFQKAAAEDPTAIVADALTLISGGATAGAKVSQVQKASTLNKLRAAGVTGELSSAERTALIAKAGKQGQVAETLQKGSEFANKLNPYIAAPKLAVGATTATLSKAGQAVTPLTEYATKLATGIDRETQQFIKKFPEEFKKAKAGEITREKLTENVTKAIDEKIEALSDTGKGYETIRKGNNIVSIPEGTVNSVLEKYGISLDSKGKVITTAESVPLSPSDIGAIESFVSQYGREGSLSGNAFLNTRKALDNMSKWESGKTDIPTRISQDLRKTYDSLGKEQIPGLSELDGVYGPQKVALENAKKQIIDSKGNLKDNAQTILANITNLGKEGKLAKIEAVAPGTTIQANALKAFEDVQKATEGKVGMYARGAVIGGTAAMASIPAAAAAFIATYPPLAAKVLEIYGTLKNIATEKINTIKNKVLGGEKLSLTEQQIMFNAIKETPKESITNPTKNVNNILDSTRNTNISKPVEVTPAIKKINIAEMKAKQGIKPKERDLLQEKYDAENAKAKPIIIETPLTNVQSKQGIKEPTTPEVQGTSGKDTSKAAPNKEVKKPTAPSEDNPTKGGILNVKPQNQVKYNQGNNYAPVRMALSDKDAQISRFGALDTKSSKQFTGGPKLSESEKMELASAEKRLGMSKEDIRKRVQELKDIAKKYRDSDIEKYIDVTSGKPVDITSGKIPEGYFKNAFGEIVKNPSNGKKGSLNVGQIGKNLGFIKKSEPTQVKKLNTGEDITLVRGTGGKGSGAGEAIRGKGLYLTDNVDVAKHYGPDIKSVTIKNSDILDGNVKLKESKSIIAGLPKEMKSYLDPSFDYTYNSLIKTIEGNTGLEAEAIAEAINGSLKGKYKGVRFEIGIVNDTLSEKGLGNKNAFVLFDNKPSILKPKAIGESVGIGKVPDELKGLAEEAKKYKSAEEFSKKTTNTYHGTSQTFDEFSKESLGRSTSTIAGKRGFWFTDDIGEAKDYAKLSGKSMLNDEINIEKQINKLLDQITKAEKQGNWDLADKLSNDISTLEQSSRATTNEIVMPVRINKNNLKEFNADGISMNQGRIDDVITQAKKEGKDGVFFKNISDNPESASKKTNQYFIFDPKNIQTEAQLKRIWKKENK